MKTTVEKGEVVRNVLMRPHRSVVELVDDLLALCREQGLQLDWQAERCRVRSSAEGWEDSVDIPHRKSVFRAILARVAVLCNERTAKSVSAYGGQGELSVGGDPPVLIGVRFVNTPAEQRLELTPKVAQLEKPSANGVGATSAAENETPG